MAAETQLWISSVRSPGGAVGAAIVELTAQALDSAAVLVRALALAARSACAYAAVKGCRKTPDPMQVEANAPRTG
ncbi:hypothetical protein Ato02nite_047770 [Paractinoplanes toevensis]|uniref:Uncharacterized protein n=1 Tax=Paractinoplanes toevensis TaxID=571911 RepID=A0A919TF49_9ACTN|nr:hypothetical protein Ato02nite_047770 [Actinoplanes toevensis]